MTTTAQNFEIYKGDDLTLQVTVKNADGTAKDLTGATIKWQLSTGVNATPALISKQNGSGITITDAVNGIFEVAIAQADTSSLAAKDTYYHEAEVVDASAKKSTVLTGTAKIKAALIS